MLGKYDAVAARSPPTSQPVTTCHNNRTFASAVDASELLRIPIIGRPNVGKSTLYNRLVGKGRAPRSIVSPYAGTTRDRREGRAVIAGSEVMVVDTGGLDEGSGVNEQIREQVGHAVDRIPVPTMVGSGRRMSFHHGQLNAIATTTAGVQRCLGLAGGRVYDRRSRGSHAPRPSFRALGAPRTGRPHVAGAGE